MSFDSLLPLYGHLSTVVQRAGRTYPVAAERYNGSPVGLIEPVEHPPDIDTALRSAGQRHLLEVADRSASLHDGQVLACLGASDFPLVCTTGGYFDAIATCDSLSAEYLERSAREPNSHLGLGALPLRCLAHEACDGDPLRSGRGRVAAVGVSVAVTVPTARGRALVLGLRSNEVATDPGIWHVAPSGTLEPSGFDPVIDVVARELAEELKLDVGASDALSARLKPLGVGFDLLRLRPEICLRLDLAEPELPRRGLLLSSSEFQDQRLVDLSESGLGAFWVSHPPEVLTPAAAAAIALLEMAQRLTTRR